ncbi:MAG: TonB-dependent receptor [Elusimicrobiota bacterium]|jgi:iron complex outermembrane receptor protein
MRSALCLAAAGLALPMLAGRAWPQADDAFSFFAEEAKVITASRRIQSVREAPVAVEVISAAEIKASGAINLWDLLRFRAGIDAFESRNAQSGRRSIVSVRGFSRDFVSELQVLVDGRSVYDPIQGGVGWENIPVQIQDIERIEIVRGPNAVLYGSNSALGVINIITRTPSDKRSATVRQTVGSMNTHITEVATESSREGYGFRLSHTYSANGGFPKQAGGTANDFAVSNKTNFRGYWQIRPDTKAEILSGVALNASGVPAAQDPQHRYRTYFNTAKLTHDWSGEDQLEVRVSQSDSYLRVYPVYPTSLDTHFYQWDSEAVQHMGWWSGRMQAALGVSYRYAGMYSDQIFGNSPFQQNRVAQGFLHDTFKLTDELTVVGGVSAEHSDTGGWSPAFQATGIANPWTGHTFRASYSQASTIPSPVKKYGDDQLSPTTRLVSNPDMIPDRLSSYDLAYIGEWFNRRLATEADLYYMVIKDRTVVKNTIVGPAVQIKSDNSDRAIARGAELKLRYDLAKGANLYANYTREVITDIVGNRECTASTPVNKFNLGGRARLGPGWSAAVNAGYKDGYLTKSTVTGIYQDQPAYWRLDAGLAYSPRPELEFFFNGQNLLIPKHREFNDAVMAPRAFYGGATLKFGGS